MPSYGVTHPYAFHVLPLHVLKEVLRRGALLSACDRANAGLSIARRTTSAADAALGFSAYVHTYLVRAEHQRTELPLLVTQLGPSAVPPFPHVALRIPTASLSDEECTLCMWNVAVSRPGVPEYGVKGGNWTRGTRPERIAEVWDLFRETQPDILRARGFFEVGIQVPVLRGARIAANVHLLNKAAGGIPELLLGSPFRPPAGTVLEVYAEADAELVRQMPLPEGWRMEVLSFPAYTEKEQARAEAVREAVRRHLGALGALPDLDFDRLRARAV